MRNLRQASVLFHSYVNRGELPPTPVPERDSDCWPDWGSERLDAETRAFAERNRPFDVLRDIGWTCAYFVVLFGVIGTMVYFLGN